MVTLIWHACKYKVHKLHLVSVLQKRKKERKKKRKKKKKVQKREKRNDNKKKKGKRKEKRMYLWRSLFNFYLHASQVRDTVGDSGLSCVCVTYFEH